MKPGGQIDGQMSSQSPVVVGLCVEAVNARRITISCYLSVLLEDIRGTRLQYVDRTR
jgi:hypothetical protein